MVDISLFAPLPGSKSPHGARTPAKHTRLNTRLIGSSTLLKCPAMRRTGSAADAAAELLKLSSSPDMTPKRRMLCGNAEPSPRRMRVLDFGQVGGQPQPDPSPFALVGGVGAESLHGNRTSSVDSVATTLLSPDASAEHSSAEASGRPSVYHRVTHCRGSGTVFTGSVAPSPGRSAAQVRTRSRSPVALPKAPMTRRPSPIAQAPSPCGRPSACWLRRRARPRCRRRACRIGTCGSCATPPCSSPAAASRRRCSPSSSKRRSSTSAAASSCPLSTRRSNRRRRWTLAMVVSPCRHQRSRTSRCIASARTIRPATPTSFAAASIGCCATRAPTRRLSTRARARGCACCSTCRARWAGSGRCAAQRRGAARAALPR